MWKLSNIKVVEENRTDPVVQSGANPTGDQEVASSIPARSGNILSWRLIMKYFLPSFSPFRWFRKGSHYQELSYYRNCHSDYRYSILDRLRLIPFDRSSYLCSWCVISSVSHTPTVLLQSRLNHVWMHFRILDPIYTGLGPSKNEWMNEYQQIIQYDFQKNINSLT